MLRGGSEQEDENLGPVPVLVEQAFVDFFTNKAGGELYGSQLIKHLLK